MTKLTAIKIIHTLIWIFFNIVLFYLYYAVISNKIDRYVWIGLSLFVLEGLVLLIFNKQCPLTIVARRYSNSNQHNFDIYLPNWLAKYNKPIYTILLLGVIVMLLFRLF
jgi:hypothetical protein